MDSLRLRAEPLSSSEYKDHASADIGLSGYQIKREPTKGGVVMWVIIATIAAGALIGFVTGGARVSSAGHVTTGVSGFFVGAFATRPQNINVEIYAKIFCLYVFSLFLTYVIANILRHKKKLEWLYGKTTKK
jgi:hypothetical protein